MKVIAVADVHGDYDQLHSILKAETPYDALVIAGDLTTWGTPEGVESRIRDLQHQKIPLFVVAGNMDPPGIDQKLLGLGVSINGRGRIFGGVGFFGVSGTPFSVLNSPNEISEEEILDRAEAGFEDVEKAEKWVFVPHSPPMGTQLDLVRSGDHVGSVSIRAFIERVKPHLVLCGHIHEARGEDRIGNSRIVNCGPVARGYYAVVTIDTAIGVELKEIGTSLRT